MMSSNFWIFTPSALNEIGGRGNNEDSIFPAKGKAIESDRLFLVCDGVGGANKGEVASYMLCKHIPSYFNANNNVASIDKVFIQNAIKYAENKMTKHLDANMESKNMASTLTLLYINNDNINIAWAGDSRVYHIRDGAILYKTKDHSLVNFLIDQGEITEHEAINHPKKNQILRAVKGSDEPVKIDIKNITNIKENDFFFLCTDGVLENFTDEKLAGLFNESITANEVIHKINKLCFNNTRDNYSCYVVKINKVKNNVNDKIDINYPKTNLKKIVYILSIILVGIFLYYSSSLVFDDNEINKEKPNVIEVNINKQAPDNLKHLNEETIKKIPDDNKTIIKNDSNMERFNKHDSIISSDSLIKKKNNDNTLSNDTNQLKFENKTIEGISDDTIIHINTNNSALYSTDTIKNNNINLQNKIDESN